MDVNELIFLGSNKYGQAGIGEKYHNKQFSKPKFFTFSVFIKQIACGAHHSAMLSIDGFIYTMGSNIHGALGSSLPNLNYSFSPILVESLKNVSKIDCGSFHMCAISNGELYSWGKGIDGQLGHGNTKNVAIPTKVQVLGQSVEKVSCGTNHTLVLVQNEQKTIAYAFGNGIFGQLGVGNNRNSYYPVRVKLDSVEEIASGQNHSLFMSNGSVYACGDNTVGQIGVNSSSKKYILQPALVVIGQYGDQCLSLQAGKYSAVVTNTNQIYVWGSKMTPQLMKLELINEEENVLDVDIIDIRVGNEEILALTSDGDLYSCKLNQAYSSTQPKNTLKVLSHLILNYNSKSILDFSIGQNYSLILGDIIRQVPLSNQTPNQLQHLQIDQLTSNRVDNRIDNRVDSRGEKAQKSEKSEKAEKTLMDISCEVNSNASNSSLCSNSNLERQKCQNMYQRLNQNRLKQEEKLIESQTYYRDNQNEKKDEKELSKQKKHIESIEISSHPKEICSRTREIRQIQPKLNSQVQKKLFSPSRHISQERSFLPQSIAKNQVRSQISQSTVQQTQRSQSRSPFRKKNVIDLDEPIQHKPARFTKSYHIDSSEESEKDFIKTPSSSILCEPNNFLRESISRQNQQNRKEEIEGFSAEFKRREYKNHQKIRTISKYQDKQNNVKYGQINSIQKLQDKKVKTSQRIDKIMTMLEKSSQLQSIFAVKETNSFDNSEIPSKTKKQSNPLNKIEQFAQDETTQCKEMSESGVMRSNRLLRLEIRDRQLKISQLQQTLSRKQMEIEAQRELIKVLRQKNVLQNFSSEES